MSIDVFILLAIGAMAGGFVNGLAGFGTSLFALGWWLQIMPPIEAVALALAMSVVSGVQGLVIVWRSINWPRLMRFLVPAVIGVPIGLQLLSYIDPTFLKIVIGLFLILYGGFFTFRKNLPNLTRPTHIIDGFIGFISGILGATAGLSGALPTMWCSLRPWSKTEQRSVLQPFNSFILGCSATILAYRGIYSGQLIINLVIVLVIAIIAARIGITIFKRLTNEQFRRLLISLMFVAGFILLGKELF